RINQIITSQGRLLTLELGLELEQMAQNYAARIISSCSSKDTHHSLSETYSINPDDMKLIRPRRVGIEQLALHAISQLGLEKNSKY
ncbi:MAG: hypothetical protein KAG66_09405, partial [Methylococcales bacterium]|nr:hypothetical protein [Methylococcales bacterium]